MKKKPDVNCPTCTKKVPGDKASNFWPFCSERCKLIDLGEWAKESYKIAGEKTSREDEDNDKT